MCICIYNLRFIVIEVISKIYFTYYIDGHITYCPYFTYYIPHDDAYRADTRKLGCKKTIPEDFLLTLKKKKKSYRCVCLISLLFL